jgi:hypothetical protein
MQYIALFGAGGKMGIRITRALRACPEYHVDCVEPAAAGRQRLADLGAEPVAPGDATPRADAVILAVPDNQIGEVARTVVPALKPGAIVITLDPAAPFAGQLPPRADIAYFVTHPSHPPLFSLLDEPEPEARRDYWGGGKARQSLVNALLQGSEEQYQTGEAIARCMFGPIARSHRVTVEQMALLEPALSETLTLTCLTVIREGMDEVVRRGVSPEAAHDFLTGHLQVLSAILFGALDWQVSDGAKMAVEAARPALFRPDWQKVFELDHLRASVARIVGEPAAEPEDHGEMYKGLLEQHGGKSIVGMDTISHVASSDRGQVVLCASHGGVSSGRYALQVPLGAVFFNDAGVGKDGAGIAALGMLQAARVPAGAYSHASARIGDVQDAWANGIVSRLNQAALAAGLEAGQPVRDALRHLLGI